MCNCICNEDNEEITWRWADKIGEIQDKIEAQTPEYLDRYDDLVWLRARLMDYTEAIEATILGYDPDNPGPEAVFGDTTLEETIEIMATLPTVPEDVNRLLESIRKPSEGEAETQMENNPIPHNHSHKTPLEDLPDVQAQYWEDGDLLDVHTGDTTGVSATIAHGMYIFRNKDDEVSGFCIIGAVGAFRAGISKTVTVSLNDTQNPFDDLPEIHVEYLESSDLLQIHTGDMSGTCTTIASGMDVYQDKIGDVTGFCLTDASLLLKPVLDSLDDGDKLTLANIVASAGNSGRE